MLIRPDLLSQVLNGFSYGWNDKILIFRFTLTAYRILPLTMGSKFLLLTFLVIYKPEYSAQMLLAWSTLLSNLPPKVLSG